MKYTVLACLLSPQVRHRLKALARHFATVVSGVFIRSSEHQNTNHRAPFLAQSTIIGDKREGVHVGNASREQHLSFCTRGSRRVTSQERRLCLDLPRVKGEKRAIFTGFALNRFTCSSMPRSALARTPWHHPSGPGSLPATRGTSPWRACPPEPPT